MSQKPNYPAYSGKPVANAANPPLARTNTDFAAPPSYGVYGSAPGPAAPYLGPYGNVDYSSQQQYYSNPYAPQQQYGFYAPPQPQSAMAPPQPARAPAAAAGPSPAPPAYRPASQSISESNLYRAPPGPPMPPRPATGASAFGASPPKKPSPIASPPPFSPGPSPVAAAKPAPMMRQLSQNFADNKQENAHLTKQDAAGRDYVLLIDQSGSMMTEDCPPNDTSRWEEAKEGAIAFATTMARLDPDGIDVALFNDAVTWFRNVDSSDVVEDIFTSNHPRGGTILAPVLKTSFDNWFKEKKRPMTIVIITDGQPNDHKEVVDTIVATSKRLFTEGGQDEDLGISFVQIGYDRGATRFLKMLDDDLQDKYGAPFDLVDTVSMDKVAERGGIKQVLIDAVND